MRKIEVAKRRKALNLLCSVLLLSVGLVGTPLGLAQLSFGDLTGLQTVVAGAFLVYTWVMAIEGFLQLYRNWYQGRIHTIFLVNTRTLAALPARGATVYIKRVKDINGKSVSGISHVVPCSFFFSLGFLTDLVIAVDDQWSADPQRGQEGPC